MIGRLELVVLTLLFVKNKGRELMLSIWQLSGKTLEFEGHYETFLGFGAFAQLIEQSEPFDAAHQRFLQTDNTIHKKRPEALFV